MTTTDSAVLTPIDKVLSLQSVDVFRHATTEMLAYIGSIATELRMKKKEVVFLKDQLADAMYVVVSGRVRLEKEGKEVLTLGAGQSFGTWALFDDQPRLMTAVLLEDAHLLKIRKEDFYDLLADHDEITPVIFKALVERVKSLIPD
jgi:CRP-like cAMP-binding protein